MKRYLALLGFVIIWISIAPLLAPSNSVAEVSKRNGTPGTSEETSRILQDDKIENSNLPNQSDDSSKETPVFEYPGKKISLYNCSTGTTKSIYEDDYIRHVLINFIDEETDFEVIKALVTAVRTYTLYSSVFYCISVKHHGADICNDSEHCLEYSSANANDELIAMINDAIAETDGYYIFHKGNPICALFHRASSVSTESYENLKVLSKPYLVAVQTPEQSNFTKYSKTVNISKEIFAQVLSENGYYVNTSVDHRNWIGKIVFNKSNRCQSLQIGATSMSGSKFAQLFNLESTCIMIVTTKDGFAIMTEGSGNGLGMSIMGAQAMAERGDDYKKILEYYYSDSMVTYVYEGLKK